MVRGAGTPTSPTAGDADKRLGQEDIEKLLGQAGKLSGPVPKQPPAKEKPSPDPVFPGEGEVLPGDMEYLLGQAERALASIDSETCAGLPPDVTAFRLEEFSGAPASAENATLDLIRDVELDLKIELGRTHMYLEDVLKLRRGSVVPLDKLAGDPVDIYVNGRLIARGEVLVLNDNFCVRVAELIAGAKPAA
jgi:flagellar motor switch protein FliN/FliY